MRRQFKKIRGSSIGLVLLALLLPGTGSSGPSTEPTNFHVEGQSMTDRVLFAFEGNDPADSWMIINDGVMGGLSRSRMFVTDESTAVFEGDLSLSNNGGFASVRSQPEPIPTAGTSRLAVRVRGDGREYQLRIRTEDGFNGVAYRWNFTTRADEWMTIEAPYREFVPTFRGRIVRGVPPIDPDSIRHLGFLIADKQERRFRLEVDWIRALD